MQNCNVIAFAKLQCQISNFSKGTLCNQQVSTNQGGGDQGGCKPRIEVIVIMHKKKEVGGGGVAGGVGSGVWGRGVGGMGV